MNATQTVFTVFYAVFWGLLGNVQPRWKAFHWAYWWQPQVQRRLILSVVLFNFAPIAYFGLVLYAQTFFSSDAKSAMGILDIMWGGAIPAFGAFSFYRLWLAVIEANPKAFYTRDSQGKFVTEDASKLEVIISTDACKGNLWSGVAYLLLPLMPFAARLILSGLGTESSTWNQLCQSFVFIGQILFSGSLVFYFLRSVCISFMGRRSLIVAMWLLFVPFIFLKSVEVMVRTGSPLNLMWGICRRLGDISFWGLLLLASGSTIVHLRIARLSEQNRVRRVWAITYCISAAVYFAFMLFQRDGEFGIASWKDPVKWIQITTTQIVLLWFAIGYFFLTILVCALRDQRNLLKREPTILQTPWWLLGAISGGAIFMATVFPVFGKALCHDFPGEKEEFSPNVAILPLQILMLFWPLGWIIMERLSIPPEDVRT